MEFLEALDQGTWNWFQAHRKQVWLNDLMVGLGWLSQPAVLTGIALLTVLYLGSRRRIREAGVFGVSFLLGMVVLQLTYQVVARPRPQVFFDPLEVPRRTPSFPCDQTLLATIVFVGLGLLAARVFPNRNPPLILTMTAVLVFLVGASRLYVGQCYFTDVLAGWMVGTALALACRVRSRI